MPATPPRENIVINGRLMRPASREYNVLVFRHGRVFLFYPGRAWHSNQRIRAFAHTVFVKYFGREPDRRGRNWHQDGFMAECCDRRGNCVQVEQTNRGDPRHTDGTWNQPVSAVPAPLLLLTWPAEERRVS